MICGNLFRRLRVRGRRPSRTHKKTISGVVSCIDMTSKLVYYRTTMIQINVHEAKTHLSRYLADLEKGETIVLCRRNQPVAELRPISRKKMEQRPIGLAKGTFTVPDSFFDDLPDETIVLFSGETP